MIPDTFGSKLASISQYDLGLAFYMAYFGCFHSCIFHSRIFSAPTVVRSLPAQLYANAGISYGLVP